MQYPLEDYLKFLRQAGVRFGVSEHLQRDPDHDGLLMPSGPTPRRVRLPSGRTLCEHFLFERHIGADHATVSTAGALEQRDDLIRGKIVVDLGCGTGLLGIVAALGGARRVIGIDVDPTALALADRNAEAAGVLIEFREGSLCDPLETDLRADMFLANLPHKPVSDGSSIPISQAGGPDGGNLFQRALPEIARRQELGASLLFFLHSLTTPRLLRTVQRHYDLDLLCWKLRWLGQGEYGMLRENFRVRARKGLSFLYKATQREAMVAGVWLGRRKESA